MKENSRNCRVIAGLTGSVFALTSVAALGIGHGGSRLDRP